MAIIREDQGDASADASTEYTIALGDVFQGTIDSANDTDFDSANLDASDFIF